MKVGTPLKEKVREIFAAQNLGFSGTTVVSGKGLGVVIATGSAAQVGQVVRLSVGTRRVSSFEKSIARLSRFVLALVLFSVALIFLATLLLKGSGVDIPELLLFSVALAVAVIPEALPVVATFSLSNGALHLAKHKVVIRRLSAVEDLGSAEVFCTDKTGTLTENRLTVSEVYGKEDRKVLLWAAIAGNGGETRVTNPFDQALLRVLSSREACELRKSPVLDELPFDPERRRNTVAVSAGSCFLVTRGAPEKVLSLCRESREEERTILRWISNQGKEGRRVLAVATKDLGFKKECNIEEQERDLDFLGLVSFEDPLKESARGAVQRAERLGVQVKILTGDHPELAGAIAAKIGLISDPKQVLTGEQFDRLTEEGRKEAAFGYHVFARFTPTQKFEVVRILEEKYEVGFLGEGINDAPALKAANVAVVVPEASDIARDSADVVLLDRSLNVIIEGIEEGRKVFANTIKYIKSTLASNYGNFYALAISSLLVPFLPMLPLQILLLNLLSDFPMISVATDSVEHSELLNPRRYNLRELTIMASVLGVVSTFFDFLFFFVYRSVPAVLQTNWFIGSVLTEIVFVFSVRTQGAFFRARFPSTPLLALTGAAGLLAVLIPFTDFGQAVFKFVPPTLAQISLTLGIVAAYFLSTEIVKLLYYRFLYPRAASFLPFSEQDATNNHSPSPKRVLN